MGRGKNPSHYYLDFSAITYHKTLCCTFLPNLTQLLHASLLLTMTVITPDIQNVKAQLDEEEEKDRYSRHLTKPR